MSQIETRTVPHPAGPANAPGEAGPMPEEFCVFLRQIGSPDGFCDGPGAWPLPAGMDGPRSLADFLEGYQTHVLVPLEMPAITRAHFHVARGHARELIALDQELESKPVLPAFASASRRMGRAQLERLEPLRDERTVQRYLAAVRAGKAAGWHTVVYGMTLAIYSWPLRHGLLTYARETLSALALASRPPSFPEAALPEILQALFQRLPSAIEQTLAGPL